MTAEKEKFVVLSQEDRMHPDPTDDRVHGPFEDEMAAKLWVNYRIKGGSSRKFSVVKFVETVPAPSRAYVVRIVAPAGCDTTALEGLRGMESPVMVHRVGPDGCCFDITATNLASATLIMVALQAIGINAVTAPAWAVPS